MLASFSIWFTDDHSMYLSLAVVSYSITTFHLYDNFALLLSVLLTFVVYSLIT
jgi:hypothetical protein